MKHLPTMVATVAIFCGAGVIGITRLQGSSERSDSPHDWGCAAAREAGVPEAHTPSRSTVLRAARIGTRLSPLLVGWTDSAYAAEQEAREVVDSAWKSDPEATAWTLAVLLDPMEAGIGASNFAQVQYRRRSGNWYPALFPGSSRSDPSQSQQVLSALVGPVPDSAALHVVWHVCDAAWALRSLRSDSVYYAYYRAHPSDLFWVHETFEVFGEASRILRAPWADSVAGMAKELELGNATVWP